MSERLCRILHCDLPIQLAPMGSVSASARLPAVRSSEAASSETCERPVSTTDMLPTAARKVPAAITFTPRHQPARLGPVERIVREHTINGRDFGIEKVDLAQA